MLVVLFLFSVIVMFMSMYPWFCCRMKTNIVGMEANMEQLLSKVCIISLLVYCWLIFTWLNQSMFSFFFFSDNISAVKKWHSEYISFRQKGKHREITPYTQFAPKSSSKMISSFHYCSYSWQSMLLDFLLLPRTNNL